MEPKKQNMASATRALRQGGKALEEMTGSKEPTVKQPESQKKLQSALRLGFRRLGGME